MVGSARNNNDHLSTSLTRITIQSHACSLPAPRSSASRLPASAARSSHFSLVSPVVCPCRRACPRDHLVSTSSFSSAVSPYDRFRCRPRARRCFSLARRRLVLIAFARSHAWVCPCFVHSNEASLPGLCFRPPACVAMTTCPVTPCAFCVSQWQASGNLRRLTPGRGSTSLKSVGYFIAVHTRRSPPVSSQPKCLHILACAIFVLKPESVVQYPWYAFGVFPSSHSKKEPQFRTLTIVPGHPPPSVAPFPKHTSRLVTPCPGSG